MKCVRKCLSPTLTKDNVRLVLFHGTFTQWNGTCTLCLKHRVRITQGPLFLWRFEGTTYNSAGNKFDHYNCFNLQKSLGTLNFSLNDVPNPRYLGLLIPTISNPFIPEQSVNNIYDSKGLNWGIEAKLNTVSDHESFNKHLSETW